LEDRARAEIARWLEHADRDRRGRPPRAGAQWRVRRAGLRHRERRGAVVLSRLQRSTWSTASRATLMRSGPAGGTT
jgi:hypothetical protein